MELVNYMSCVLKDSTVTVVLLYLDVAGCL